MVILSYNFTSAYIHLVASYEVEENKGKNFIGLKEEPDQSSCVVIRIKYQKQFLEGIWSKELIL